MTKDDQCDVVLGWIVAFGQTHTFKKERKSTKTQYIRLKPEVITVPIRIGRVGCGTNSVDSQSLAGRLLAIIQSTAA